ncbi:uncharacterized protein ACRADG_006781 [Cochliomyia hominivorax]
MELNMNANLRRGYHLEEDDNFSNISRLSCGFPNSSNSNCNSDSECCAPLSVRDMIKLYNNQSKEEETNNINHKIKYKLNTAKRPQHHHHHHSQHLLAATKSSYCGLNNYGSHLNAKQFVDQIGHKSSPTIDEHNQNTINCCNSCSACMCCQNRNRINTITTKMLSSTSTSSLLLQQNNENNQKRKSNISIRSSNSNSNTNSNNNCNKINAKDLTQRFLVVENCNRVSDDVGNSADINTATTIRPNILSDFNEELNKNLCNGLCHNNSNNYNSQPVVGHLQQKQQQSKNRLLSIDSVEEANICQETPIETSYQSKTTIAKTSSGVRIIIDIFFDQERCANTNDIVGSRVETDIPQSRILNEFQQQTLTGNSNNDNNNNILTTSPNE